MISQLTLESWQSRLEADVEGVSGYEEDASASWLDVTTPHNWQDYHGYRAHSTGDLYGRAFYRTQVDAGDILLAKGQRIQICFEAVAGTATVSVNGQLAGQHIGSLIGFELDITRLWNTKGENLIEVQSEFLRHDETQPFVCGGSLGAPFSEGPQPSGICRPVHLKVTGETYFARKGLYTWCDRVSSESAEPMLRCELSNPSGLSGEYSLEIQIADESGPCVLEETIPVSLDGEALLKLEQALPSIKHPRLWSPKNPQLYRVTAKLFSGDGVLCDQEELPCGFRQLQWPVIAEPNADHDVRSADSRGECVDDGLAEAGDDNNFYNSIRSDAPNPAATFEAGSVRITGTWNKAHADIDIAAKINISDPQKTFKIMGEITNDLGTVFYHQFSVTPGDFPLKAQINDPKIWVWNFPFLYRMTLTLVDTDTGEHMQRLEVRFAFKEDRKILNIGRPVYEKCEECAHPTDAIAKEDKVFRMNGEPTFLHGSCAYETMLGKDYAWEEAQVESFCARFAAAGFNAFRDGHLPHHLHTYSEWDRYGILCWTQMGSHLYFDNDEFRANFKSALRTWVRERRNHPCIFAWGLQNESIIPEDFARELCDIIREEDPTASKQRYITTCNGGKGTDWNVPQEWSGTYGGNCHDSDVEHAQLIGEYGSWRLLGHHTDKDYTGDENDLTESWASYSLGVKLQRAIEREDRAMGLFQWAFASFPNPGRSVDRMEGNGNHAIAPINSKGLLTAWLQPTDAYYLYQSALADPRKTPMVYIVSHTWPERWSEPGTKDRILVYSNCEEVELFNDVGRDSLGVLRNPACGKPFRWDGANIRYGLLYAEGRVGGKTVAKDIIRVTSLPEAPGLQKWIGQSAHEPTSLPPNAIRLNCGGPNYTDQNGHLWIGDQSWTDGGDIGSLSWGDDFQLEDKDLASIGTLSDLIRNTREQELYQTFRYGLHRLRFKFNIPSGTYRIHLGVTEPWNGVGCQALDCTNWRLFDLAANGETLLEDIDPWAIAGTLTAGRVTAEHRHKGGILELHFPRVAAGQAIVNWIAIEPLN